MSKRKIEVSLRSKRDFLVYVAGPYRANSIRGTVMNIRRAEAVALEVWKAGYTAICPHMNTALFDGSMEDDVWLAGDLAILRRCDAVIFVDGWNSSEGTLDEMRVCQRLGLPVCLTLEALDRNWKERMDRGEA